MTAPSMNAMNEQAKEALLRRRNAIRRLYAKNAGDRQDMGEVVESDWPDRASDKETATMLDRLSEDEHRELIEIDAALRRISEGSFGKCESCGGAIGRLRLRALPETRLCITCSAERAAERP
jgi:DnaK suppressor protein